MGQTVIDYEAWQSSDCNAFSGSVKIINGVTHQSVIGQPQKVGSTLNLASKIGPGASNLGTEYRITYNFKPNYSYKITINAARTKNGFTGPDVQLRTKLTNVNSGNTTLCNGPQQIDPALTGNNVIANPITNSNFSSPNEYVYSYNAISIIQPYLLIAAVPGANMTDQTIQIKKITIVETASVDLVLSPSSVVIPCGAPVTKHLLLLIPIIFQGSLLTNGILVLPVTDGCLMVTLPHN